jgi:hypothetical protein
VQAWRAAARARPAAAPQIGAEGSVAQLYALLQMVSLISPRDCTAPNAAVEKHVAPVLAKIGLPSRQHLTQRQTQI